ncbi:MAG: aminofutalosine synthase MqnE, partial [Thermoleophilia bacterium]
MAVGADNKLIEPIEEKVRAGERLSPEDGVALFGCNDLIRLGRLADHARRRAAGDDVYFVNNRHINHTNVCGNRCR